MLSKARNAIDATLDGVRRKDWEGICGENLAMIHNPDLWMRRIKPRGALTIGYYIDMSHPRSIQLYRAQGVHKFVVLSPARIVYMVRHMTICWALGHIAISLFAPCRVVAIHPRVDKVHGKVDVRVALGHIVDVII
jgi:hypothetical protein